VLDDFGTVGGGSGNTASGGNATVAGGSNNTASVFLATVAGGGSNTASSAWATVAGGRDNTADGENATVGGGELNTASGARATVPGGVLNAALGRTSFAAGKNAKANHNGTFVWADYSPSASDPLVSTSENQFLIRAAGGVGIGTNAPDATVHVLSSSTIAQLKLENTSTTNYARISMSNSGSNRWDIAAGAALNDELNLYSSVRGDILSLRATGSDAIVAYGGATLTTSGVWANASTFEKKTDFTELDTRSILETLVRLPVRQWRYKVEPSTTKHVGPTAEDFHEAFNLGESSTTIGTVDADGVALAAIQGLYELVQELQAENKQMRAAMARAGIE
jgi:hypothetical protein